MSDDGKFTAEEEIDDIVTAQADNETAWEEPIQVRRPSSVASIIKGVDESLHKNALSELIRHQQTWRDIGLNHGALKELAEQQLLLKYLPIDYWKGDFAKIASDNIASLSNIANSSFFEASRLANLSIVRLLESFQEERHLAQMWQVSEGWTHQLGWIKGVDGITIGKAVSAHLAAISQISVLAQSTIARLAEDQIAGVLPFSLQARAAIQSSFAGLSSSYRDLFASFERENQKVLSLPPLLTRLPAIEFFNAVDLLSSTSDKDRDDEDEYEEEKYIIRVEISRDTHDALEVLLSNFDPTLIPLRNGAKQALQSNNPDRVRHFITSYRELFTHILQRLAPDEQVRSWSSDPEHYAKNRPTRKARLLYIGRHISEPTFAPFLEKDIDAALEALQLFQKGTHAVSVNYSTDQLTVLEIRIEATIRFMLEVSQWLAE